MAHPHRSLRVVNRTMRPMDACLPGGSPGKKQGANEYTERNAFREQGTIRSCGAVCLQKEARV